MRTPAFLYRYRLVNEYSLDEIRRNQVYFSPLSDLNDMAEGRYSLGVEDVEKIRSLLIARALDESHPEFASMLQFMPASELQELAAEKMAEAQSADLAAQTRFGVVCFSERYDNEMMWGHYAANGKGFVIEYDLRSVQVPYGALQKVIYSDDPATICLSSVLNPVNAGQFVQVLSVKKKCWEHEEEWRLLLDEPKSVKPLPFRISRVITGPRCSDEDKTIVVNAILQHGSARFAQAYLDLGPERQIKLHDLLGNA